MKLWDAVNNVLERLDDYPVLNGESVWTRDEIEIYVKDGYDTFCRKTKCIFDMVYPENVPTPGNHTAQWELTYFQSGMIDTGLLGFSGGYWEQDYAESGTIGPVNHTQPWETDYISTTFVVSRRVLPDDNVTVQRAMYDWQSLSAEFTQWFEDTDKNHLTVSGDTDYFSMDRDGINTMRLVPAGDGGATEYTVVGDFGILRYASSTELGSLTPLGTWGSIRELPQRFPIGAPFGIPRRLYDDTANNRVEYFRHGRDLDEDQFELPLRFVKYVEYFACSKALERDGPGQDIQLSNHFMQRFEEGAARMSRRMAEVKRARVGKIGSAGKIQTKPALARLPWRYGRQIRRGY